MARLNKTPLLIRAKRGLASQVTASSPVPYQREGEIAYSTDTKAFYISDGNAFNFIGDGYNSFASFKNGVEITGSLNVIGNIVSTGSLTSYTSNSNTTVTLSADSTNIGGLYVKTTKVISFRVGPTSIGINSNPDLNYTFYVNGNARIGQGLKVNGALTGSNATFTGTGTTSSTTALLVENANASASMAVLDDGNVGIGTTSPSAKLDVNGSIYPTTDNTSTLGLLQFKEWSYVATRKITGDNNRMVLELSGSTVILRDHNTIGSGIQIKNKGSVVAQFGDSAGSGNVGIGTTTPSHKLDVSGSGNFTDGLTITGSTNIYKSGSTVLNIEGSTGQLFSVTDSLTGSLFSVNTVAGLPVIEAFSDNTVNIGKFGAYPVKVVNSGTEAVITGSLFGTASYVPTLDEVTTAGNTTTNAIEVGGLTVYTDLIYTDTVNGRVGIGTTSPVANMTVNGTFRVGDVVSNSLTVNTSGATIISTTGGNEGLTVTDANNGIFVINGGSQSYRFLTLGGNQQLQIRDKTNSDATRLAITSTGNVLIGTTTDSGYKLDVNGTARVTDDLRLENDKIIRWGPQLGIQKNTYGPMSIYGGVSPTTGGIDFYYWNSAYVQGLKLDNSGNFGIGTTSPTSKLHVKGSGTTSATTSLLVENANASASLWVTDDQIVNTRQLLIVNHATRAERSLRMGWGSISATDTNNELTLGSVYTDNTATRILISGKNSDNSPPDSISMQANNGLAIYSGSSSDFFNPQALLHVSGSGIITNNLTVTGSTTVYKSGSTVLDVQGSQGQLFSVVDELSGSLMSVNDVSGLPILEVFSDDRVEMGTYGSPGLVVTGSDVTLANILTITPQDPLPSSGVLTGSFAVSSSAPPKPYFWDGSAWNALY